ncbi:uncharacterized protein LOC135845925 [Planococcus citri]|uniref:uncharacterized protein LOC135845925 n=1 Tax=Planococcus citri TaxID=170843 RepID=UPI0031F82652
MKSDVMLAKNSDNDILERVNMVKEFVHQFVQDIIEEAIKQSSQTTWLIHCSENCHKLNDIQPKQQKAFLYWTPESNLSEIQPDDDDDCVSQVEEPSKYILSCKSIEMNGKPETLHQDIYSLPVDSIRATCSTSDERSVYYKVLPNCSKCLKPKAIHALNLFKSTHQKTFSDLKVFLLNLYSSSDISVKKIGSENSAFTTYSRRNTVSSETASDPANSVNRNETNDYECFEKTLRFRKKEENLKLVRIKNEKDLIKPIRKCNRLKRRNFFSLKHSFCSVFKSHKPETRSDCLTDAASSFKDRSLPPVPNGQGVYADFTCGKKNSSRSQDTRLQQQSETDQDDFKLDQEDHSNHSVIDSKKLVDFASNIEKVKDYGWYWGPMSSDAAEKLLLNEPDGSFIVRDSSDDRYIFSLTFKLNACIRHVRIEHGQGNFSFGSDTNFKSDTIVDFIENAVQHSRSGRYLFFIHRRPGLGPMRVLLLYPVSRFKGHMPSLQHMCRFVILKSVRRDLIPSLPLPKPLLDYLSSKDYYTEQSF